VVLTPATGDRRRADALHVRRAVSAPAPRADVRRRRALVASIGVVFLIGSALAAQPAPPQLTGPVNDFASTIDAESRRELDRRIRALQQATGDVVAVATVPDLAGFGSIEELALRMFENGGRGIGQKGKDNGALIVLALKERQVRVEVGYDLEEFITDGYAGETIRETMVPHFRESAYGRGLLAGATRIINRIAQRRGVELENVPRQTQPITAPRAFNGLPVVLLVWIIIMVLSNRRRRRRGRWGRGPWSGWNSGVGPFGGTFGGFGGGFGGFSSGGGFGGGGGGGFGGFGGGRSGGGGASGGW
jgi:uncharacterized protein